MDTRPIDENTTAVTLYPGEVVSLRHSSPAHHGIRAAVEERPPNRTLWLVSQRIPSCNERRQIDRVDTFIDDEAPRSLTWLSESVVNHSLFNYPRFSVTAIDLTTGTIEISVKTHHHLHSGEPPCGPAIEY